jgi:hypothetical protein
MVLANYLGVGRPRCLNGSKLELIFPVEQAFAAEHIDNKRQEVEELIFQVVEKRYKISVATSEDSAQDAKQERITTIDVRRRALIEAYPLLQQIIETFDAKIMRITDKEKG